MKTCPRCNTDNADEASFCSNCGMNLSGDLKNPYSVQTGVPQKAEGSTGALVCGIIGLFCCGIVMGIIAIILGIKAREAIKRDPGLSGSGNATAGIILGIIDIIGHIIWLIIYFAFLEDGYLFDYF